MSREINENELENIGGGSEDAIISTDAFRGLGLTYHEFDDFCDSFTPSRKERPACENCLYGACVSIYEERKCGMACFLKK